MDDLYSCVFCGRYVLQMPGWTTRLESYRMHRSPWLPNSPFLSGSLHYGCLRAFAHRDRFRADALELLTSQDHRVTIDVEGRPEAVDRPGLAYSEQVFSDGSGDLFRHVNTDHWVFVETEGPFHFLAAEDMAALSRGQAPRKSTGALTTLLPREPDGPVEQWPLDRLLAFLDVTDLYQDALDTLRPAYECWEFAPVGPKFHLDYSVDCDLRLPAGLTRFCESYAYRPRAGEWE